MDSGIPQKPRGTMIADRYEVVAFLGAGRMGSVYVVNDHGAQGSIIALRMLPAALCSDPVTVQRLSLTVQAMKMVRHANVAKTFDSGARNGECFFTMEYLRGSPLSEYLAQYDPRQPYSWQAVSEIFGQICLGLHAIHAANLIHGNLSAFNIFIEEGNVAKLTDFGIIPAARLPSKHGGAATQQADLHTLGIVLNQLLTGQLHGGAEIIQAPRPDVPSWAQVLLEQLLSAKVEMRPKSIEAVLRAHEQPATPPPPTAAPSAAPSPPPAKKKQVEEIDVGSLSLSLREQLVSTAEYPEAAGERFSMTPLEEPPKQKTPPPVSRKYDVEFLELDAPKKVRSNSMRILMKAFGKQDALVDPEKTGFATVRSKSLRMMLKENKSSGSHHAQLKLDNQAKERTPSMIYRLQNMGNLKTRVLPPKNDIMRVGLITGALAVLCCVLAYPRYSYLLNPPPPVSMPQVRADQGELSAVEHYVQNFRRDFESPEKLQIDYQAFQSEMAILLPEKDRDFREQTFTDNGAVVVMSNAPAGERKRAAP